jgi:hypothetical protein
MNIKARHGAGSARDRLRSGGRFPEADMNWRVQKIVLR